MQQTLFQPVQICGMLAPFKPIFRLFIACEDQAAFLQAGKVEEQVRSLCGNEIQISRVHWNFALLRHERLRQYAVTEAAESEMIVLSFRAGGELPPHVKCWVESLPVRPQAGEAALVALIGSKQKERPERRSQVEYLRRIAESRGLDFFCNQDGWQHLDFSNPAFRRIDSRPLALESIIFDPTPWSTGGINE